mgnify:CR=1 FL=1
MRGMVAYIIRRLLLMIPLLLGVTLIVFFSIHLIPGDPVMYMLRGRMPSREVIERMRAELGLNLPLHEQYFRYLSGLLRGDWGTSLRTRAPVLQEILSRYPNTIVLAVAAMFISVVVGVIAGIISAVKRYSLFDYLSMAGALFGVSMPSFWLGLMLILIFAVQLRLLPVSGYKSPEAIILPAITLGTGGAGVLARLTRSSMLEVLGQDYVRTARAKGLAERIVIYRHALKNALIPVLTMAGMQFGFLLGGAVIVEMIFAWPGIGRLAVMSIYAHDIPVVQGCTLFFTAIFILTNLAVDILYAYIDPRIRYR